MKMYKVSRSWQNIEEIDVVRKSDVFVWILNHRHQPMREAISTSYTTMFDTWEDAKNHIVARELHRLNCAKGSLESAHKDYEKALNIKH